MASGWFTFNLTPPRQGAESVFMRFAPRDGLKRTLEVLTVALAAVLGSSCAAPAPRRDASSAVATAADAGEISAESLDSDLPAARFADPEPGAERGVHSDPGTRVDANAAGSVRTYFFLVASGLTVVVLFVLIYRLVSRRRPPSSG